MQLRHASVALLALAMILWSACFWTLKFPVVGPLKDDGYYVVSATALRDGQGYSLPSRPGPPGRPKYPIGFPTALAAAFWITGSNGATVAYGVILIAGCLFGAGVFVWIRRMGYSDFAGVLVAAGAMFGCISRNAYVMADIPLCATASVLFARLQRKASIAGSAMDGALAACAFLLRRQGIALLPACLIVRRERRSAMALLAGFLALDLPFEWYTRRFPVTLNEGYMGEAVRAGLNGAAGIASVVLRNAKGVLVTVPQTAVPFLYTNFIKSLAPAFVTMLATLAIWILMARGAWSLRKRRDLLPVWIFCAITLAIIVIWPWSAVAERLAMPLAAVTLLALGLGAADLARSWRVAVAVWVIVVCGDMAMAARTARVTRASDPRPANLARVFDVIRARVETDAVIAAEAPEMIYLYTGRQAIRIVSAEEDIRIEPGAENEITPWLSTVGARPLYLLGSCANPPDTIAKKTLELTATPGFAAREIFRTPDCQYWLARMDRSTGR